MAIIDAIIKANKEGREVTWPSIKMGECYRCEEEVPEDDLYFGDMCQTCYEDMTHQERFDEMSTHACIAAGR